MAQFAADGFTGTNGDGIPAQLMVLGGNWTEHSSFTAGHHYYQSNRARGTNASNVMYAPTAAPSADYSVQATVTTRGGGSECAAGVVGRMATGAITFYWADYYDHTTAGSRTWRLYKYVAGTPTSLGSYTQNLGASATATVKLSMVGTAIKTYVDGVERISATDSAISAAGYAGVISGNATDPATNSVDIDDFTADTIPTGVPGFRRRPLGLYTR